MGRRGGIGRDGEESSGGDREESEGEDRGV